MKKQVVKLTQAKLKELLSYDPETGIFTRAKTIAHNAKFGDIAGSVHHSGYSVISIDNKKYFAHRLAFLYMEGYIPEYEVDHINRNRLDNRFVNLRHVSRSCNMRNKGKSIANKSGVVGVYWKHKQCRWYSFITINKKEVYIGFYKSFEKAVKARWEAENKYGFLNCNSTSSAYLYLKDSGFFDKDLKL